MDDQEYQKRYNELFALLERAYIDYYYLQTIGDIQEGIGFTNTAIKPLSHICELLKTDLCLLIWKTCIDTGSDTNTLRNLKNDVFKTFGTGPKDKYFQNISSDTQDAISKMRSNAIAHTIAKRNLDDVKIADLYDYLFEGIRLLNDLCFLNKGVMKFDETYQIRIRLGLEGTFRWILKYGATKEDPPQI